MPVELKIPAVGESINEVTIGAWRKSVGERVERDEEIVELETDKATFDLPAPAAGVITKILKQPGDTAAVGEVIGYVGDGAGAEAEQPAKPAAPSTPAAPLLRETRPVPPPPAAPARREVPAPPPESAKAGPPAPLLAGREERIVP